MHAIIKNFRGISEAEIQINNIALICGLNGQGKTSIAKAIASAASGKAVPFDKLTKKDSGIMLRHGSKNASVELVTEKGSSSVAWPKGEVTAEGSAPIASLIATGLTDLLSMKEDDALTYLIDLLKANPTEEDFAKAMKENDIEQAAIEAIWKVIQDKDWVSAHKRAVSKGIELKGAWSHLTGQNFGTKAIEEWYPPEWHESMLAVDLAEIQTRIADAKTSLEQLIGKNAVSQAERDRLQGLADRLTEYAVVEATAKEALDKAQTALNEVDKKLAETPNPSSKRDYACPHCEGAIHVSSTSGGGDYALAKAVKVPEAEIDKARMVYAGLCGEQQNKRDALSAARTAFNAAVGEHIAAARAKDSLESTKDAVSTASPEDIQKRRDAIANMEKTVRVRTQYDEVTKVSSQLKNNLKIVALLDESGIRKTKVTAEIGRFNYDYIDVIRSLMEMPPIELDVDLNLKVGDTPFQMLSAAEQFKTRTVIQMAIAKKEKASLLIIDGADIIVDGKSRGALFSTIEQLKLPTVICMSLPKPDRAPNLADMGLGTTYWVQDGKCNAISQERAAA